MNQDFLLQQAEILDNLLELLGKDPEPNRPTRPWYLHEIEDKFGVDHFILRQILKQNKDMFSIVKEVPGIHGQINGEVVITAHGRYQYKMGFSFRKKLLEEQAVKIDQHSVEYQRAYTLDQIFKKLGSNTRGKQMLSTMLSTHLSIPDTTLDKLLNEEPKYFKQLSTSVSRMANGNATMVELTQYGEKKYKEGWTFVKQLTEDQLVAVQEKKSEQRWAWVPTVWNIVFGLVSLVLLYLTLNATRENKLHNEKEERWEVEKREMQSTFEILNKQYQAIPDSIRKQYE